MRCQYLPFVDERKKKTRWKILHCSGHVEITGRTRTSSEIDREIDSELPRGENAFLVTMEDETMNPVRYEKPEHIDIACKLLAEFGSRAAVLAGGTDLLVYLRSGQKRPELVIDIKGIEDLHRNIWHADGGLELGACVTLRQIAADARIRQTYPAFAEAAESVGSYQVRCRATVGGNLCNASPCADMAPVLLAHGALLRVAGPDGERESQIDCFFLGVKQCALKSGEILTHIVLPPPPQGGKSSFHKATRLRGHDLALVSAAGMYDPATRNMRVALGSVATTPLLITCPDGLCRPGATPETVAADLAAAALAQIKPIDDVRASARYRLEMAELLCRRVALDLLA